AAIAVTALLTACAGNDGDASGDDIVVGGMLGNAFRSEPIQQGDADVALADLLKTPLGREMTEQDRRAAALAWRQALNKSGPGGRVAWRNRSSAASGEVVPGTPYQVNSIVCRDYTHIVRIGEAEEAVRGSACRQQDGNWRPIV